METMMENEQKLPSPPSESRSRPWLWVVLAVVGVLIVGGIGAAMWGWDGDSNAGGAQEAPTVEPEGTRFEEAFAQAGVTSQYITVEDGGTSIIVDGPPDDTNTNTFYPDLASLLTALDVPAYVVDQIDSTSSLQGLREASWNGIEAQWSYHPDNGLDLTLVDTEA
jgi:hypothetical protein